MYKASNHKNRKENPRALPEENSGARGHLVVLLQGPVIICQDLPCFWRHEAIGGILSFPGQLPHPCPGDEVKLVVPVTGQPHTAQSG